MNLIAYDDDSILLLESDAVPTLVIQDTSATPVISVGEQGPQGIQGPAGGTNPGDIELTFAWNDVTTVNLSVVPANKLIRSVQIFIITPFNGTNPSLQVGDAGAINRLMDATQVNPAMISEYTVAPVYEYSVSTQTILTITPGTGASAGTGLVRITVQA